MAAMIKPRPKSAAPTYKAFQTSGVMARSAGCPGMFGSSNDPSVIFETPIHRVATLQNHALKTFTPYAQTATPGWLQPGKEASVVPKASVTGAGVVSAGSIDNTYLPQPLTNAWGKARERASNEIVKPPRKQATDLLLVTKGIKAPAPSQTVDMMEAVRPAYSRTIPVYHPMDPMRVDSGFVRSPNLIPGAAPPPKGVSLSNVNTVPTNHKLLKLAYDQSLNRGRIPVSRTVRVGEHVVVRPKSAAPMMMTRPAGLPGGLSLIG
jgi:hypothetical protein